MSHNTTNTTNTGSSRNLPYALAMGPADLRARARCSALGALVRRGWPLLLRVVDSRRCRINLLRGGVDKDHHARLRILVNDEHALAIPVRCGLDTGLGVRILRPLLFEVLVGVGKLAGGERFTRAGLHYDARSASVDAHSASFFDEPSRAHRVRRRAGCKSPALPY